MSETPTALASTVPIDYTEPLLLMLHEVTQALDATRLLVPDAGIRRMDGEIVRYARELIATVRAGAA